MSAPEPLMADKRDDPRYQRLLSATRKAAEGGYDAVSMRELAETCRMSMTTIYKFCRSKDQLIAEAHAENMQDLQRRLHARPRRGGTPAERVASIMRSFARSLESDETLSRTLMRAVYSSDPNALEAREPVNDAFYRLIDDAIGEVELPDRDAVIATLGHVMDSTVQGWLIGRYDARDVQRELLRTVSVVLPAP